MSAVPEPKHFGTRKYLLNRHVNPAQFTHTEYHSSTPRSYHGPKEKPKSEVREMTYPKPGVKGGRWKQKAPIKRAVKNPKKDGKKK